MHRGWAVGVVIPAHNESQNIPSVIRGLPTFVDKIIVVDDMSSDGTREVSLAAISSRIECGWSGSGEVIGSEFAETRRAGVGAAVDFGIRHISSTFNECWRPKGTPWCVAVVDGDGQMDPAELETLIQPIISGNADHVKGSRILHKNGLSGMPIIRRLGTWMLTHLTNLASGLKISDPQSGYAVTSHEVISSWKWDKGWDGYGYPNHRLMKLSNDSWRISEVPVKSIYNKGQKSRLNVLTFLPSVALMLLLGLFSRGKNWYMESVREDKSEWLVRTRKEKILVLFWFGGWLSLILSVLALFYQQIPIDYNLVFISIFVISMILCRNIDRRFALKRCSDFYQYRIGQAG